MPIPSLEPDREDGLSLADWSGSSGLDDDAFETIGQSVRHAAGAIDGLKDTLERLQRSVWQATEQRRNDIEIGQLFTRAQDFVEAAVSEANELAQQIVADAEFEAAQIITAAKEEAHRLIEDGRLSSSLPSEVVRALETTIGEFSRMNSTLADELAMLTEALTTRLQSQSSEPEKASSYEVAASRTAELIDASPLSSQSELTVSRRAHGLEPIPVLAPPAPPPPPPPPPPMPPTLSSPAKSS